MHDAATQREAGPCQSLAMGAVVLHGFLARGEVRGAQVADEFIRASCRSQDRLVLGLGVHANTCEHRVSFIIGTLV